jgi:hypothetical protein
MGPGSTTSSSDAPSTGIYTAITSPHAGEGYDEFPELSPTDLIEPLAIVGFSLKFPEDATDADSFWEMLINGRNVSTKFPSERLNIDSFNDPKNDRQGTVSQFTQDPTSAIGVIRNVHLTSSMVDFNARRPFHQGRSWCF